jgi:predicted Kef-type K+ transport protein
MRVSSKKIRWPVQLLRRADRVAADLNVILVVFTVGLATLDLTCLVAQKVISQLPDLTRLAVDSEIQRQTSYSFINNPLR